MKKMKILTVGTLAVLMLSIPFFMRYTSQKKPLQNLSRIIERGRICDLRLTIYYISPHILTNRPWDVETLIDNCTYTILIDGKQLEDNVDLLSQFCRVDLVPIALNEVSCLDARIHYIIETNAGKKILDVSMWGFRGDIDSIYVNGVEIEGRYAFYEILMPFLPDDATESLEKYISMWPCYEKR